MQRRRINSPRRIPAMPQPTTATLVPKHYPHNKPHAHVRDSPASTLFLTSPGPPPSDSIQSCCRRQLLHPHFKSLGQGGGHSQEGLFSFEEVEAHRAKDDADELARVDRTNRLKTKATHYSPQYLSPRGLRIKTESPCERAESSSM
jgi:hypothetical protein